MTRHGTQKGGEDEQTRFDLTLVGAITRDRIVSPQGVQVTTGGAVYYGALPAALHGIKVAVLTRLAPSDGRLLDELKDAGIAVFARWSERTTEIENVARSADFERRRFVVNAVADPFSLDDLESVRTRVALICPLLNGEFPLSGIGSLARRSEVALDVQGFIRCRKDNTLQSSDWLEKREALAHVTYLKTDKRETEILTGLDDMAAAARVLSEMGPREVLVTHPGGIHLHAGGREYESRFDARQVRGRTGRGDTAIASYLARRFTNGPEQALRWTATLVSRKLETPGPFRGPIELLERPH